MLRYFYLLCLLLCIRDNFCYEYISDQDSYSSRRAGRDRLKRRKLKDNGRRFMKRHDYDMVEDRDPVAQIDVAGFIQNPDYEAVDENNPYMPQYNKNERLFKDYDYGLSGLNIKGNVDKRSHDYTYSGSNQMNDKPSLYQNMINPQHNLNAMEDRKTDNLEDLTKYPNEFLTDNTAVHKPMKKCPLKHMKIPFFSHKKSGTTKAKKIKKRKLFCFNCTNKTKVVSSTPNAIDPNLNMNKNLYKINKRSYNERICPLCRRKLSTKSEELSKKRRMSNRMIHNSRQFYQDLNNIGKDKPKKDIPLEVNNYPIDVDNDQIAETRRKRGSIANDLDKERQLKELDEVQKKIDSLEIKSPVKKRDTT